MTRYLGSFNVGEQPADPIEHTFINSDGSPVDLTHYGVKFEYGLRSNTMLFDEPNNTGADVSSPEAGGVIKYWEPPMYERPGEYVGWFRTGTSNRGFRSTLFTWDIVES